MKNLYPHNQEALGKVLNAFANSERTCIVQPTGTGKAYITGALARSFENVLVIAPNDYVLNETRKTTPKADFRTYASLLFSLPEKKYDLIVFDEFHRMGAHEWGKGVENLLEEQKGAKIFGASATPIRYLDNERNMAQEAFGGNIAHSMCLREAFDKGLLPIPKYVTSLYSIEPTINRYMKSIGASRLPKKRKQEMYDNLERIRKDWAKSTGVPHVLAKHFPKNARRVLVFCTDVSALKEYESTLRGWMREAQIPVHKIYKVDYDTPESKANMTEFQEENYTGVKVMMSVNMLNEGVHVPNVDVVILLRGTISRIIFEQQIGRCLTVDNPNEEPVIFDLVNNVNSVQRVGFNGYTIGDGERATGEDADKDNSYFFHVVDEIKDLRFMLNEMGNEIDGYTYDLMEIRKKGIKHHYEKYGHLPRRSENDVLYAYVKSFRDVSMNVSSPEALKRREEMIAWLETMGFDRTVRALTNEERWDNFAKVCDETNAFPKDTNLLKFFNNGIKGKYGEAIKARCEEYAEKYHRGVCRTLKHDIGEFFKTHEKLDFSTHEGKVLVYRIKDAIKNDAFAEIKDYLEKVLDDNGYVERKFLFTKEDTVSQAIEYYTAFFDEHGRFPNSRAREYTPFKALNKRQYSFVSDEDYERWDAFVKERKDVHKAKVHDDATRRRVMGRLRNAEKKYRASVEKKGRVLLSDENHYGFQQRILNGTLKGYFSEDELKDLRAFYDKYKASYDALFHETERGVSKISKNAIASMREYHYERMHKRVEGFIAFCEENGRLPLKTRDKATRLWTFMRDILKGTTVTIRDEDKALFLATYEKYKEVTDEIIKARKKAVLHEISLLRKNNKSCK